MNEFHRLDQQAKILTNILVERRRQDEKWGTMSAANVEAIEGLAILVEEVGEVAKALLDGKRHTGDDGRLEAPTYRAELVQVAAVAVALLEAYDMHGLGETFRERV